MARVLIDGAPFKAQAGERLSEFLRRVGKPVSMPCGGRGDCGKCRVTVNGQTALACEYVIESDITVILPEKEEIEVPVSECRGSDKAPQNAK